MSQINGYARVSTAGQSLEVQLEKLKEAGCTRIWAEKKSGRYADNRPELRACLDYVREGDTFVITRLDRAARSVLDLSRISDVLRKKGVVLRVLDQGLDTSTSEGMLMFNLLGAFAEFESDIRRQRVADGLALAKKKGVRLGRRAALTEAQVGQMRRMYAESDFSIRQLEDRFGVSRATVYRALGDVRSAEPLTVEG